MTVKEFIKKLKKVKDKSAKVWIHDIDEASYTKVKKIRKGKYKKATTLVIVYSTKIKK